MEPFSPEGTPSKAGPSILIVDDYLDLAEPLARLLTRMGYSADVVHNGDSAIRYLQQRQPALVILDLIMPDINGLDVLKWLRSQASNGELPVIVYTSSSDEDLLRLCLEARATEVWLKGSLDFFQIMARVDAHVPRSRKDN